MWKKRRKIGKLKTFLKISHLYVWWVKLEPRLNNTNTYGDTFLRDLSCRTFENMHNYLHRALKYIEYNKVYSIWMEIFMWIHMMMCIFSKIVYSGALRACLHICTPFITFFWWAKYKQKIEPMLLVFTTPCGIVTRRITKYIYFSTEYLMRNRMVILWFVYNDFVVLFEHTWSLSCCVAGSLRRDSPTSLPASI